MKQGSQGKSDLRCRARAAAALALIACLLCVALLGGCGGRRDKAIAAHDRGVMPEEEFGGVYIDLTIEEFNALGFAYGDGVDVVFSNGYRLEGIPYYNGYYTQTGQPLLVAYPGYPYIKACINNGDDLWKVAGLKETDRAEITLAKRGQYQDIQNARDIHYEDDRSLFASDAVFANFRSVRSAHIQENTIFRAASPCNNEHNRAPYVDALIAEAGVKYIVNLADNEKKIQTYLEQDGFDSPYFLSLYESGNVILLGLNMNFSSDEFREKVVRGLSAMAEHEGPYLVHCTEGKDRTGFVCMLLEALCGASYQEIVDDYMITYDNYYGITKTADPDRYGVIVENLLVAMLHAVIGDDSVNLETADYGSYAQHYLLEAGMPQAQIDALKAKLAK